MKSKSIIPLITICVLLFGKLLVAGTALNYLYYFLLLILGCVNFYVFFKNKKINKVVHSYPFFLLLIALCITLVIFFIIYNDEHIL